MRFSPQGQGQGQGTGGLTISSDPACDLTSLALRARSGPDEAVDTLMARVRPLAHRYCRARLTTYPGGFQLADDVAQEVCLAVLAALPRYRDQGRPFEAFVHGVCSRKVADAQRAQRRVPLATDQIPDQVDDAPNPEEQAVFRDDVREVLELLDQLPVQLREVMIWRVAMGMSAEETGRALEMSAGAVRVAQHRALKLLRSRTSRTPQGDGGGRHG